MKRGTWSAVSLLFAATGCYQDGSVEAVQWNAKEACFIKSTELLGRRVSTTDPNVADPVAHSLAENAPRAKMRFLSTSQFVIEYGEVISPPAPQAYTLTCTGDFKSKALTTIQIDGELHRPKAGESWIF